MYLAAGLFFYAVVTQNAVISCFRLHGADPKRSGKGLQSPCLAVQVHPAPPPFFPERPPRSIVSY
jgi:hypothetical protein